MEKNNVVESLKFIFSRAIFFYFLIFIMCIFIVDFDQINRGLKIRMLNLTTPKSFDYLYDIEENEALIKKENINLYVDFFKRVIDVYPERPDVYSILGFCFYKLGDIKEAKLNFEKALETNPEIFWFNYSLGLIYFEDKDYDDSLIFLQKALTSNPNKAANLVDNPATIYSLIKQRSSYKNNKDTIERLKDGYTKCFLMLVQSFYYKKDYSNMLSYSNKAIKSEINLKDIFYFYAGVALYELKKYNKAIMYFKEYLRRDEDNADAYNYIGLCLKALNRKDIDEKIFDKAKSLLKLGNSINSKIPHVTLQMF